VWTWDDAVCERGFMEIDGNTVKRIGEDEKWKNMYGNKVF